MIQVNMLEAKTELSKLVKKLEDHEEDVVVIARNGKPVVQMVLIPEKNTSKRIGVAKGKIVCPMTIEEWKKMDEELLELFEEDQLL
ncbi:MAG: hypothetical protein J6N77_04765 [Lachnospiraceae bacterium]|nr:hypothetical protein [Lachnospiraceae bacterium]